MTREACLKTEQKAVLVIDGRDADAFARGRTRAPSTSTTRRGRSSRRPWRTRPPRRRCRRASRRCARRRSMFRAWKNSCDTVPSGPLDPSCGDPRCSDRILIPCRTSAHQEVAKLLFNEARQSVSVAQVRRLRAKRLEMVAHQLVQRTLLGPPLASVAETAIGRATTGRTFCEGRAREASPPGSRGFR